jgi:hypothetical protein
MESSSFRDRKVELVQRSILTKQVMILKWIKLAKNRVHVSEGFGDNDGPFSFITTGSSLFI